MRILVVEDEILAAERLVNLILEIEPSSEILDKLDSVRNTIKWLAANKAPDLIFMDIQLADGLCFEIFEKIKIDTPVIFTTAYNEYALKAFKVNSIDYLLKPISGSELENALNKFRKLHFSGNIPLGQNHPVIKKVMEMIQKPYKSRYVIRIGEHIKTIHCDEISMFFSSEKSSFIRTIHNRDFGIDTSLDQIEEEIEQTKFFRVNRKQIISINSIKDIIAYSGNRLKIVLNGMEDEEVIVSREKVGFFKEWLEGK